MYNTFPLLWIAVKYSKVEENKNNTEEKNKEERLLDRDEHRKGGLLGRKVAVSPESVLHNTQTTSHCIQESHTALHTWALQQHCSTIWWFKYAVTRF